MEGIDNDSVRSLLRGGSECLLSDRNKLLLAHVCGVAAVPKSIRVMLPCACTVFHSSKAFRLGGEQLSLRDLAREIGVSHAASRRHFADRQALLDALAETGFTQLDTALRSGLADADDDFRSRLRVAMATYIRFATENAALLELMYTGKHRPGAERIAAAAAAPFALMNDLVVEGREQGVLQAADTHRLGLVLFATLQGIASLINGEFVETGILDELVETALEQFLCGARTRA